MDEEGVGGLEVACGWDVCSNTPVVFKIWAHIPVWGGTGSPWRSVERFVVNQYFGSWWGEWCVLEVEDSKRVVVGR